MKRVCTVACGAVALLCAWLISSALADDAVQDALVPPKPGDVKLSGHLGERISSCISNRVMAQDIGVLIRPYRERKETGTSDWRCEYWGKWYTSAVLGAAYDPAPKWREIVDTGVRELLATQLPDGYIGTRTKEHRREGWDVWGRKYALLGLLAHYDLTGSKATLESAKRHADAVLAEIGPGKADILSLGMWEGMASSSILEPMVLLYRRTGEARYLDFALYIVKRWDEQRKFFEKALAGGAPPSKAYEGMSCIEGLCELYRATGDKKYLEASLKLSEYIMDKELFVVGSGSSGEVWFQGRAKQTRPIGNPMETCVTATWIKLCYQLLRLTGEARFADEMERSTYNALLAALKPDGRWWCYFTPMQGVRSGSYIQHDDVGTSCCVLNGPRALFLAPFWSVMSGRDGPVVNLYCAGTAAVSLVSGNRVRVEQDTDYPVSGAVRMIVQPEKPEEFVLSLRVPSWSARTSLKINGQPYSGALAAGTYARVKRAWTGGDTVELSLDMRGRIVPDPAGSPAIAVMRGPIVLATDKRLSSDAGIEVATLDLSSLPYIELGPSATTNDRNIWMAFALPCISKASGKNVPLAVCDFASAGNTWGDNSSYRVWLDKDLDFSRPLSLDGVEWIWCASDPADAEGRLPVGTRYFRAAVTIPEQAAVAKAKIMMSADNSFKLYVNGREIGKSGTDPQAWMTPPVFDITGDLKAGKNLLAVEAVNNDPSPAGLIGKLVVTPVKGDKIVLTTGSAWKTSEKPGADWNTAACDDAAWPAARAVGTFGCKPWGVLRTSDGQP